MLKQDDHLLAFISGLLCLSGEQHTTALKSLERLYELHEPRKPERRSLGARELDGREVSGVEWLRALAEEPPRAVRLSWWAPVDPALPPHIAAAFEGAQTPLLLIETATGTRTYRLNAQQAPQYALGPEQFIELVNAQEQPEPLWERIRELISESNEMNNQSPVAPGQTPAYLLTAEGAGVYDFLVTDLNRELQIECSVLGFPFQIPASLKDMFEKSGFEADPTEQEHVSLYAETRSITPQEVHALIAAQPFAPEEVWARVDAQLREYTEPDALPASPREWPATLDGMPTEELQGIVSAVCQALRSLCGEQGRDPIIPESLKTRFGPDGLEKKRAKARGRISSQWFLRTHPHPWKFVFFEQIPLSPPSPGVSESTALAEARFRRALETIEAFAVRQESPFSEAFRLGRCLLGGELPPGGFGPEHRQRVLEALVALGFSEQAQENARKLHSVVEGLSVLGWPTAKMFGLMAVAASDVFGGMGSWNDAVVEDGDEYQRLSAELFQAMNGYFAALLSWTV